MYERFSDRARHAMALANLEASKFNHDFLAPAHLMLGLIAEGKCVATEAMQVLHVDLEQVRADVRARLEEHEGKSSVGRRVHTKAMKSVIEGAIREVRQSGHHCVGTEHLLLALLQQTDAIPSEVLRNQGLELDGLRQKLAAMLRADLDPAHDLTHARHGMLEWVHQQELTKAFRSPHFWRALILAVDAANRKGADEVEPVHLLLALLRDKESGMAALLAEKGVTSDWVLEKLNHEQDGAS